MHDLSKNSERSLENGESHNPDADDAFVALLTSSQRAIGAYLNSILPNEPAQNDIQQRVNIVLWKKRSEFELGTNFKAWAFSVTRWTVRAWLTEQKRHSWLVFDDELTNQIAEHIEEIVPEDDSLMMRNLRICLSKLSDKQRILVFNYYQLNKTMRECAKKAGLTEGALRVSLYRIRENLRNCINDQIKLAKEGQK